MLPVEDLEEIIIGMIEQAKKDSESKVSSLAGMMDLLVHPNGEFCLINTRHLTRYKLCKNKMYKPVKNQ
ncbi:hypothetical protein GR7B_00165 [Vibrio phage vB_VcorM_GR7B]|nr:hypothetical protein GR7B_00165 [Vibrio phage vB_VcorM_GR7B]